MKKLFIFLMCFLSFSTYAASTSMTSRQTPSNCGTTDVSNPNFCGEFASIAYCYCGNHLPAGQCQRMKVDGIFHTFVDPYGGNISAACSNQRDFPDAGTCTTQWTAYRSRPCPPAV